MNLNDDVSKIFFIQTDELNLKQIAHDDDDLVRSCNLTQTENDI